MKSLLLSLLACLCVAGSAVAVPLQVIIVSQAASTLPPGPPHAIAPELASVLHDVVKHRGYARLTGEFPDDDQLARCDVLVLHAAEPRVMLDEHRTALEAFAKRGGGLVVLHGAIGAGSADWWKPLVGGAWTAKSHKFANKLMLFTLTDSHPIVANASPFDLDDETYYDLETDPQIDILASAFTPKVTGKNDPRSPERADRANVYDLQPQMWAYTGQDGHRAVVLLQGEAKSLDHPSIRAFILRAIAWAAKHENVDDLCDPADIATMRYPKDGARTAQDTIKSFDLSPGFKASVIASEPLITKPIAMQWDPAGRLWIAETPEYPNGRRPLVTDTWKETGVLVPGKYDRPARDRISILSEPDANGQFTKKTVWHEGLELVTGFCLYGDGVIAVGQPDIVFIHGGGAAQKVERLYTGFTPGDTHFVANHFIAAPDGWIYADTGSGPEVTSVAHPEVKAKLSSGAFRFKPDGSAIEQVSSKSGNGFGLDINSYGEVFFGQATSGNPVQHVVLPESILAKGKVGQAASAHNVIEQRKVIRSDMPDRAPFMQIDVVGGYSSACASTIYEAGAWPKEWNDGVFCTEPILDVIHHEKLAPEGATFTGEMTRTDAEWLRAHDFWFFPVDVEFGPDGAMYVLDFYCPVVAHSDTRGPQHSKSGASVRPDRDHYFGRIYRIQHEAATNPGDFFPSDLPHDLAQWKTVQLPLAFGAPNKLSRFTALRLLMDRADAADAVPALTEAAAHAEKPYARVLALWALERLGKLPPETLKNALRDQAPHLRSAALLVVEALGDRNPIDIAPLLGDTDPRVRLDALRAMASSPISTESATALLAVLPSLQDDWSRSAAIAAASSNPRPVLEAALAAHEAPSNSLLDLAASLAAKLVEKKDGAGLGKVILAASNAPAEAAPVVRAVLQATGDAVPPLDSEIDLVSSLRKLLLSPDPAVSASALPFAVAWAGTPLKPDIAGHVDQFLALAKQDSTTDAARAGAIHGLLRARSVDPRILGAMTALLQAKLSDGLLLELISALSATGEKEVGKPLVAALPTLSPVAQAAAYNALVSRAEWANAVIDALETKELKPALLGPAKLSRLRLHSDPAIAKRAAKVIDENGGGTNPAKDEIIAKLLPEIESKPGDQAQGKALFTVTCSICHKLNGDGKEVGPVLDGIGVHGTHELLIDIIDPSRVVDTEHRTWNIALQNGQFATGIIARENANSLTLRLGGGVEQEIKVADIKSRQETGLSLMPEGFEGLGAESLRNILAYLRGGTSKYRAVNLGRVFTTDTLRGLYNSREMKNDSVQPVRYGVVTVEGIPFSLPDPSTTPTGGNVIVLKNSKNETTYAGTMPQRVEIPIGYPVGNLHFLGGVAGWGGGPEVHKPAMKVTLDFADGKTQVEELYTGEIFLDYVSHEEVPGSKRAEGVVKRTHVRYFSLPMDDRAVLTKVVLESYLNGVSPTTLAITTDNEAPVAKKKFAPAPAEALPKSGETLPAQAEAGTLRVLLVGGGSSHNFEEFFHQADASTLKAAGKIVTAYTSNMAEALTLLPHADVLVLSANHASFGTPEFQGALNAFADAGHGVVVLHPGAWYNWAPVSGYNKRFVGGGARGHGALGNFVVYNRQPDHPVMKGVPPEFQVMDEHYRVILDDPAQVEVLAETSEEKQTARTYPSIWVVKDPKARIVGIALGHDARVHGNSAFQTVLVNAVRWVGKQ